tara:strand:+ start:1045 stop:1494 length:450 start_codon:yes stop_codon:yes gene_type:complete
MKNIIFLLILFILTSCGYTSVYKNENEDIKITIIDLKGDRKINNFIKSELKSYINSSSSNNYKLIINNNYNKKINTKDTTGKAVDFQLNLNTDVQINKNDKNKTSSFFETFKMKNSSDTFALNEYENIILKNFAKSIKQKIVLELVSFE